jgi:4'-phosphopantetheinyl transferase EntD
VIETLLDGDAASVGTFGDQACAALLAEEEAVVAGAVEKRRREFTQVRDCARRALAQLGVGPVPILPGPGGCPTWPPGIVGSMTHCDGYRAAAVGRAAEILSIGIDAEQHRPLGDDIVTTIRSPAEQEHLATLYQRCPDTHWETLLFSIKEPVYKAYFPITRAWLGFEQATVRIDATHGSFRADLAVPIPVPYGNPIVSLTGRWLVRSRHVMTAIVIRHSALGAVREPSGPLRTACGT